MNKEKIKMGRCDNCQSTITYLRIKSGERVCRNCGFVKKVKIEEVK